MALILKVSNPDGICKAVVNGLIYARNDKGVFKEVCWELVDNDVETSILREQNSALLRQIENYRQANIQNKRLLAEAEEIVVKQQQKLDKYKEVSEL